MPRERRPAKPPMMSLGDADRFGFDWPKGLDFMGCHVQVTRTSEIRWKGRTYRYLTIRTPTDEVEVRIAQGGRMRVFRLRRELRQ